MRTVIVCSLGAALVFTGVSARMTAQQAAKAGERVARAAYAPPRTPWGDPQLERRLQQRRRDRDAVRAAGAVRRPADRGHHAGGAREAQQAAQRAVQRRRRRHGVRRRPPSADASDLRFVRSQEQHAVARRRSAGRQGAAADRRGAPARAPPAVRSGRGVSSNANPVGPFNSYEDLGLYDRCITRGIPSSMMPAGYGSYYEIIQGQELGGAPLRDDPRAPRRPARSRRAARPHLERATSTSISATRAAGAKATRSSSRRRTSRSGAPTAARANI